MNRFVADASPIPLGHLRPCTYEKRQVMTSLHKWLRGCIVAASLGAASYVLFTGLGMLILLPGGLGPSLSARLVPAICMLVAVILDIDIAYIVAGMQARRFITVFLVSVVATAVGAFLVSLLVFRGHLWELVK